MFEHVVGDCHFHEHFEHLEAQLSIGEVSQIARPIVVAEQRHMTDLVRQQPADRVDACLAQAVHPAELLLNRSLFLDRIVPIGVRDLGKQPGHGGHYAPSRVVRIRKILLDDLCETFARLRGHLLVFVLATEDHGGFNIPAAADAQGY